MFAIRLGNVIATLCIRFPEQVARLRVAKADPVAAERSERRAEQRGTHREKPDRMRSDASGMVIDEAAECESHL